METKITQLLDSKGIKYRLLPHEKPVFTCEDAAKERNVPLDEMIKCLLLVDKKKNYFLACIPADKMVDTRKVRDIMGCSRLSFASEQEIEEILGYKTGAIPPLLLKTEIPVLFDSGIMEKEKVNISSGDPKAGLELNPRDIVPLIKPRFGNIAK
ncbi:MAG: YbaK/EbsC family protein [Candidatus Diapherotrites archaeon]|nr:YbaK/EbsC family protein [Candidatus Diapherotrites archaeon]